MVMDTPREKVSYCIGLEAGRNLMRQFSEIDESFLTKGFQHGIGGKSSELPGEEVQKIMIALRSQVEKQQRDFVSELSEHNRREGEEYLERHKKENGVITTKSGLQYRILKKGEGKVAPKATDVVKAHYEGRFINGQVFDSSIAQKKPFVFPIGRVIPGWGEVLKLMREGDKWEVAIPHYLAYGEAGFGNAIGPNTTLIFVMELLEINPKSEQ